MHEASVGITLLSIAVVLLVAKLATFIERFGQPPVLGELLAGVLLGNLHLLGFSLFDQIKGNEIIQFLSELGVVILLFQVGLESNVREMSRVGLRAFMVATIGVVVPFVLATYMVGPWLLPGLADHTYLFLGATLTATSVGITARVFRDLGVLQSREARIVLGAAVIDDVMGLVVLAVVSGVAVSTSSGQPLSLVDPAKLVLYATLFLGGAIVLGPRVSKLFFHLSTGLRSRGVLLPLALSFAFLLSGIANWVQLAPIVGAYAAGLVLEAAHYQTLVDRGEHPLEELIHPIAQMLVPVFFVAMGSRVDLHAFGSGRVWVLAGVLTTVAVISKLACGLVLPKGYNRLAVGFGMVPRGEVGLIFADAGSRLTVFGAPLLDASDLSAIVVMVMLTTMLTPPLLGWAVRRQPPTLPEPTPTVPVAAA